MPQTADGAKAGRPATGDQVVPPSRVSNRIVGGVSVPAHPRVGDAKSMHRKYSSGSWNCSCQESPPSAVLRICPLLLTAQPVRGSTNQMSSVRELATGALVGRQRSGVAGTDGAVPGFVPGCPPGLSAGQPSSIHFSMKAMSAGGTG